MILDGGRAAQRRVLSEYLGDVGLVLSAKKTKAMRIPQEIVRPEGWKPETLASVTGTLRQQRGAKCAPHGEVTQATLRVDSTGAFLLLGPQGCNELRVPFPSLSYQIQSWHNEGSRGPPQTCPTST